MNTVVGEPETCVATADCEAIDGVAIFFAGRGIAGIVGGGAASGSARMVIRVDGGGIGEGRASIGVVCGIFAAQSTDCGQKTEENGAKNAHRILLYALTKAIFL